jgi:sarcosine oxidase subunit alpha
MSGVSHSGRGPVSTPRRPVSFTFDGKTYQGHAGDTLASALLANGVHLMGRSFKYHRPRGPVGRAPRSRTRWSARGAARRARAEHPRHRAGAVRRAGGRQQNRWPSLKFDVGAVNDACRRFRRRLLLQDLHVAEGFWEKVYEPIIRARRRPRRRADRGRTRPLRQAAFALRRAGRSAPALPAWRRRSRRPKSTGVKVILADEKAEFGGALLRTAGADRRPPGWDWAQDGRGAQGDGQMSG